MDEATASVSNDKYSVVDQKYKLKTISMSELPNNVIPVEVSSVEELEGKIKELKESLKKTSYTTVIENNIMRATSGTTTVHKEAYKSVGAVNGKITLKADIEVYTSGSFGQINACDEWTTFTGFTYGFDWNEKHIGHSISTDKQSIEVFTDGELDYYLLINGLLKVYTEPVSLEINYSL